MVDELKRAAQQGLDALVYHQGQTRPIHSTGEAIRALQLALAKNILNAKDGEVWGWAILDKCGFTRIDRPRMQDFFGGAIEVAPTTEEDAKRADLEWPGSAPHRVVTLYTGTHGWKTQHARDSAELRRLCQARDDAIHARQAAQQALQAEREQHTAVVKRLQAEIGQLKAQGAAVNVCHLKDCECGDRPANWCDECPKRNTRPSGVGSMGIPLSCGKPPCASNDHHPLCGLHQATATSLQQRLTDWADGQQVGDASDGCGESPDGRDM